GADGPGDGFAVVGPAVVVGANVGEFLQGNSGPADADCWRFAADGRHGNDIELVLNMGENPLAVGTWNEIVRRNRLIGKVDAGALDDQVRSTIGAVITQRNKSAGRIDVNAIFFVGEMRAVGAARGKNEIGLAAVSGNPDEIVVLRLGVIEGAIFAV